MAFACLGMADMGIPRIEAKQIFTIMNISNLEELIERMKL